jgi:hypothetical protein
MRRLLSVLWDPHQRLWNDTLVGIITRALPVKLLWWPVVLAIVFLDTVFLWIRALVRRAKKVGIGSLFTMTKAPRGTPILYFDLGTHKEAEELTLMANSILPQRCDNYVAFGFEASVEFFEHVWQKFGVIDNVNLVNAGLCKTVPSDGKIKLYKDSGGDGVGSSMYRDALGEYEEVQALRFSDWVRSNNLDLKKSVCLLRMNIEGSEVDVIEDLVDSGLAEHVDGYFGMWDDMSKIDRIRDDEFRALLARHRIDPFTFNQRDLKSAFRLAPVKYDIGTAIQAGVKRLAHMEMKTIDAGTS